jgi:hypothetical protein
MNNTAKNCKLRFDRSFHFILQFGPTGTAKVRNPGNPIRSMSSIFCSTVSFIRVIRPSEHFKLLVWSFWFMRQQKFTSFGPMEELTKLLPKKKVESI